MSRTTLEDLPNEIFLKIFYELSPIYVLKGWWNINARLNGLILSANYQVALTDRNVTDSDLRAIKCLRHQVVSLVLTKKWCRLLNEFHRLRMLRIIGFTRPFSWAQIKPSVCPDLISIKFDHSELDWDAFMIAGNYHYSKQIVTLHCYNLSKVPTAVCQTLRSAKVTSCEPDLLPALLRVAPHLHHLHVQLSTPFDSDLLLMQVVQISVPDQEHEYQPFTPMPITHHFENQCYRELCKLEISFDCETTLKWFDTFLSCTPNLTHLCLNIARSYEVFSFIELHRILQVRVPALNENNFHFSYCCLPKNFNVEEHRNIGPLFQKMKAHQFRSGPMLLLCISVNWTRTLS